MIIKTDLKFLESYSNEDSSFTFHFVILTNTHICE